MHAPRRPGTRRAFLGGEFVWPTSAADITDCWHMAPLRPLRTATSQPAGQGATHAPRVPPSGSRGICGLCVSRIYCDPVELNGRVSLCALGDELDCVSPRA